MKRSDIKLLVQPGHFASDYEWDFFVESWVTDHRGIKVVVPDFQRCHVWTRDQQAAYIENMLRGYPSGRDVYYNHPTWDTFENANKYPLEILDGQQRINAVVAFMNNEFPVFGDTYRKDFADGLDYNTACFKVHVTENKNQTRGYRMVYRFQFWRNRSYSCGNRTCQTSSRTGIGNITEIPS